MHCVKQVNMNGRLSPGLLTLGFLLLQGSLNAQDNQEPGHACFRLQQDREIPIPLMQNRVGPGKYSFPFSCEEEWSGKQVFIKIPAIGIPYKISINRFNFGSDPGSGRAAEFNITPFLRQENNSIELELDLPNADADAEVNVEAEISLCPLCGDGTLLIREGIHIRDLRITSYRETGTDEILIRFHLFIKSYLEEKISGLNIHLQVTDPPGNRVISADRKLAFVPSFGQETELIIDKRIKDAMLWSPANPHLYSLELSQTEKEGKVTENITTTFGIRTAVITDSAAVINGDTLQLHMAGRGLATTIPGLSETGIRKLVEDTIFNAVIAPEPWPCDLIELFDELGVLVIRKRDTAESAGNRPTLNSPSVVWTD